MKQAGNNKEDMKMDEKKICCICGNEIEGWGNNPEGAAWLTSSGEVQFYEGTDPQAVCCDACNTKYVIPGRLYLMQKSKEEVK